jgi:superfamily I DNA/RNA helicase
MPSPPPPRTTTTHLLYSGTDALALHVCPCLPQFLVDQAATFLKDWQEPFGLGSALQEEATAQQQAQQQGTQQQGTQQQGTQQAQHEEEQQRRRGPGSLLSICCAAALRSFTPRQLRREACLPQQMLEVLYSSRRAGRLPCQEFIAHLQLDVTPDQDAGGAAGGSQLAAAGAPPKEDKVVISTIHASKGLEYDTVFLMHYNDGFLPTAHRWGVVERMDACLDAWLAS